MRYFTGTNGSNQTGTGGDDYYLGPADGGNPDNTFDGGDGDDIIIGDIASLVVDGRADAMLATDVTNAPYATFYDPDVEDSGFTPHITAHHQATGTEAWFKITLSQTTSLILDVDYGNNDVYGTSVDLGMQLRAANGTTVLHTGNDSPSTDPGSVDSNLGNSFDPYLSIVGLAAGTYFIRIYEEAFGGNDSLLEAGKDFFLHITNSTATPTATLSVGNDTLTGGAGRDIVRARGGTDTLIVNHGDDVAGETYDGGDGTDTLFVKASGPAVRTFNFRDDSVVSIESFRFDRDWVNGLEMIAEFNATQFGGDGVANDLVVFGDNDAAFASEFHIYMGTLTVFSLAGFSVGTVGANDGSVTFKLFGDKDDAEIMFGSPFGDWIQGGGGAAGAAGDLFDGGGGIDTYIGGDGDDTYVLDGDNDIIGDSGGVDTITSTITRALAGLYTSIENLTLTGNASVDATGNGGANTITGNLGNNVLDGGGGSDTLRAGLGNDTYALGDEASGTDGVEDTGGIDTITSTIDRSLSFAAYAEIENLTLLGSAIVGTGSTLANTITGNALANTLDGAGGVDRLVGGGGNDSYIVDATIDVVVEAPGGGTADHVFFSGNTNQLYTLAANVERLTLAAVSGSKGTGNSLANIMTGNLGRNTLDGGAGNDTINGGASHDTIVGGLGRDTLTGGTGNDTFKFTNKSHSRGSTMDIITDFDARGKGNDKIDVSALFGPKMKYIHADAFDASGQVRIKDVAGPDLIVEVNTGGSLAADFSIRLKATTLASMTASDFVL